MINGTVGLWGELPKPKWVWYVFGKSKDNHHLMVVRTPSNPSFIKRLLTKILLGSAWEKI